MGNRTKFKNINTKFMNKLTIRNRLFCATGFIDRIADMQTGIVILGYHSISNDGWRFSTPLAAFTKQMKHIRRTHMPVSMDDIAHHISGKKAITRASFTVTFDDGYRDIMEAVPLCEALGIRPCVFMLANPASADRKILATDKKLLSEKELRSLIHHGWTVGCHSATHTDLSNLPAEALVREIKGAKLSLEKLLDVKVRYFSYPKSADDPRVVRAVQNAGYDLACTVGDEDITRRTNPYLVPRIGVDGSHDFSEFQSLYTPTTKFVRGLLRKTPLGRTA